MKRSRTQEDQTQDVGDAEVNWMPLKYKMHIRQRQLAIKRTTIGILMGYLSPARFAAQAIPSPVPGMDKTRNTNEHEPTWTNLEGGTEK